MNNDYDLDQASDGNEVLRVFDIWEKPAGLDGDGLPFCPSGIAARAVRALNERPSKSPPGAPVKSTSAGRERA